MADTQHHAWMGLIAEPEAGGFSVYTEIRDGACVCVRHCVSGREAVSASRHYRTSVAAQTGAMQRVYITGDAGRIIFEWTYGRGVTYPVLEAG